MLLKAYYAFCAVPWTASLIAGQAALNRATRQATYSALNAALASPSESAFLALAAGGLKVLVVYRLRFWLREADASFHTQQR